MRRSPLRLVLLWVWLFIALGSCSADSQAPEGMGGAGRVAAPTFEEPEGQAAMPATLRMALLRAQQKAVGYDFVRDAGGTLRSKAGGHGATAAVAATARGVHLSREGHGELDIETTSVGREAGPASREVVQQRAEGQELVLDRADGVEERYLTGPLGVEHSYLVREKRAGNGPLVIAVAFAGLAPERVAGATDQVRLVDANGQVQGGYRDLVVADAEGREIAAHMEVRGHHVALVIDDAAATYPLRVDPLVWVQQQKVTAPDGAANDYFGRSISMTGDTVVIGAPLDDDNGSNSGSAYVFVRSGSVWTQQQKLTAPDGTADDSFGESVAISGDTVVVSARLDDDKGSNSGSAYVFVRSSGVWTLQQKLTASDGAANDSFGTSVALSGDTAVIGAYADDTTVVNAGSAYVFVRSAGVWTQQQQLTASDGAANDGFGYSVALSGDTAVVSATFDDDKGNNSGSAYVFVRSSGVWTQQQKLTAPDGTADDRFGFAVAVSGDTALIGAPSWGTEGAAYVFVRSSSIWTQQQRLTASDAQVFDNFGNSVAFLGDTAVIGDYLDDDNGDGSGSAYVFARSGSVWTQQQKLTAIDGSANDSFGMSVALSGDIVIIGAYGANGKGAAYVFTQQEANGMTCTSDATCASGFCVDGVCCDTACNAGVCDACSIAAGAPSDGTCALFTGTTCNDGNACTQTDTCQAGVCTGGNPVTCTASDACHAAGSCNPATGMCSNPSKANGTACSDGNACTQTDTCQAGVCTGGNPVTCTASDSCHVAGTCNPATGMCSSPSKADGSTCNDGNACTQTDTCSAGVCGGTAYTCTPTSCQQSSACNGNGGCTIVNKSSGAACPDDGNPCTADTCDGAGACQHPSKADGTSCGTGQVCGGGTCAAQCFIGGMLIPAGTVNPANACQVCTPQSSTTGWSSRANGTSCNDGNACTQSDSCQAGVCTGGNPVTCTASDQCHAAGTCNSSTGMCSNPSKADGSACNDGNACTQSDSCQAGVCTGGNPVTCTASDQCHAAGTCNSSTGMCSNPSKADGSACNDGNACTQSDSCQAGVCTGSNPVTCTASDQCHAAGTCNPSTGMCSNPSKADGSACNDGNACTQSDSCQAGVCTGSNPVTCTASDQCHVAGTCNPATGMCSNPSAPNGTSCNDGSACTQTDTCQSGVCTGGNPVTCTASDSCHVAGTCNPSTGMCSNPSAPNGTACNDGNACSKNDVCTNGACGGTAYACTPTSCQVSSTCDGNGGCTIVNKGAGIACPDDGNACTADACDGAGACQHPSKADGTSCGAGQVCASGSCASECFIGGTLYAAGTVNPANACLVCAPQTSTTAWSNRADGTSCNDGNACTKSDVCTAGTCGGTAYTCTPTSCQASSTCDGNGGCTIVNKPNGAACPDDGNACSSDTCNGAGTCAHATLSDGTGCGAGQLCEGGSCGPKCQIGGQLYAAGTINPANACEQCAPATSISAWSSRVDGTSCDDGNACTKNDVCTAGGCSGAAYTCTPGSCDASSTCDGNGGCTVTPKGSGVACPDDGNPCTADACDGAGTCAHPTLSDGTSCAVGQVCNGGACAGECFIGGVLVAAGAVNPANACEVCAPSTSTTSWSSKADGAACDDGDACTQMDTCQAGVCTGGNPVVCVASDPCHDVGTCDSATGQCSNPAKADGAACDDGDACSQTDSCVSGVCVGGDAKSCPAIDECHVVGTCDEATGDCSAPAKADGEACSIGTCQGGVCTAAPDGGMGGSGGTMSTGGTGGSMSTGGSGGTGGSSSTSSGDAPDHAGGCSCLVAGADEGSERGPIGLVVGLMLVASVSRRRGRGVRPHG
ncbi:Thiamin-phosphate pyrophosphorylase [Minicystis rosea]|nr:Thiamin-phosphate pyrophosphorylase [Minicystis rosea]